MAALRISLPFCIVFRRWTQTALLGTLQTRSPCQMDLSAPSLKKLCEWPLWQLLLHGLGTPENSSLHLRSIRSQMPLFNILEKSGLRWAENGCNGFNQVTRYPQNCLAASIGNALKQVSFPRCAEVLFATGHSYERANIQKWLLHHNVCPISKKVVTDCTGLVTNWNLKKVIREWRFDRSNLRQLPVPSYKVNLWVTVCVLENSIWRTPVQDGSVWTRWSWWQY